MCRNRTLAGAIEDLANNVTISMLSSPRLVYAFHQSALSIPLFSHLPVQSQLPNPHSKANATTVNVTTFLTENIYHYEYRYLILSYSIAVILTLLCTCIGFFALHYNGVAHSTAFSAIIATTRNKELDEASKGHSLGALPMGNSEMRLRLGVLVGGKGKTDAGRDDSVNDGEEGGGFGGRHIGVGPAERVVRLRKGGAYI